MYLFKMRFRAFSFCSRKCVKIKWITVLTKNSLKMVHKMWSPNFRCAVISLDYHTPDQFTKCFWQKADGVAVWWMSYRAALVVYYLATWVLSFINYGRDVPKGDDKYFIYLTNWSYSLNTITCILALVLVIVRFIHQRRQDSLAANPMVVMPWQYKVYWVLHTVCLPASIAVSAIFWGAVYNPERHPVDVVNLTTHLFNSVSVLLDFLLVGHPYRIGHFHFPFLYTFLYIVFSVIYFFCGGTGSKGETAIYAILDWEKPGYAVLACVFGVMFLGVVHLVFWLLHKLKKLIRRKTAEVKTAKYKEGQENLGMEEPHVHKLDIV